ncbi:MAG: DUF1643 domain-containing protein [Gammaproteobacteria bacterium]|nr:DUF1643 domain-containing protein [Gammaproteobacteria bacterium]
MGDGLPTGGVCVFSDDRLYRYVLERDLVDTWRTGEPNTVLFIMLNPSTADESRNDSAVTRCLGFAREWGAERLWVANLFAWRSRNPDDLRRPADPVGALNDGHLKSMAVKSRRVVCAWGNHGKLNGRGKEVRNMLHDLGITPYVLGLTKDGQPKHPLYLPADTEPVPWEECQ